jgi:hypothetical protein
VPGEADAPGDWTSDSSEPNQPSEQHVRARTAAFILSGVLVVYLGMCLWKGALAVYDGFHAGGAPSGLIGAALIVFGFLGSWFLVREIQFGFATERLAVQLDDEGALGQEDLDALPRSPGGRVDKAAADCLFERRRSETEARPADWRAWYRLAAAYSAAKDNSRARAAMRHAIRLHDAQGTQSTPESPSPDSGLPARPPRASR